VIMATSIRQALQSPAQTPEEVSDALQKQKVILPSGDVKMAPRDYMITIVNHVRT